MNNTVFNKDNLYTVNDYDRAPLNVKALLSPWMPALSKYRVLITDLLRESLSCSVVRRFYFMVPRFSSRVVSITWIEGKPFSTFKFTNLYIIVGV